MSPRIALPCLLLLVPLSLAWTGGGSGSATWGDGDLARAVSVSAVVDVDAEVRVVLSLPTGAGGDALVHLRLPADDVGRRLGLPSSRVSAAYQEYAQDGRLAVEARAPIDGELSISPQGARWIIRLDARWLDGERSRTLYALTVAVDAPGAAREDDRYDDRYDDDHGGTVVVSNTTYNGGCDDDWDDGDDYDDSGWGDDSGGGCEGDDWDSSSDDDWGDDSGGCEGDDWGDDSGGGCEGDDVGGDGPSCEGDAVAGEGRTRRSPTIVRLINHLPWLLVLVGLRVARRRPRRARR